MTDRVGGDGNGTTVRDVRSPRTRRATSRTPRLRQGRVHHDSRHGGPGLDPRRLDGVDRSRFQRRERFGPPLIFEAAVFDRDHETLEHRWYATEEEAMTAHEAFVTAACGEAIDPVVLQTLIRRPDRLPDRGRSHSPSGGPRARPEVCDVSGALMRKADRPPPEPSEPSESRWHVRVCRARFASHAVRACGRRFRSRLRGRRRLAATGPDALVAPPTFLMAADTLRSLLRAPPAAGTSWLGSRPRDSAQQSGFHMEQHFTFRRPVRAGDVLTAASRPAPPGRRADAAPGR